MQEMNLLPTPESPVTRQEKMATVWDEAEVSAGRPEGRPKVWALGLDVLGGRERRWLEVRVRSGLGTELETWAEFCPLRPAAGGEGAVGPWDGSP